jgi:lycopene beta-cyclase
LTASSSKYDFIFTGCGAAGLSLLAHLSLYPFLREKRILILEPDEKKLNDRTWSFWEKDTSLFSHLATKTWHNFDIGYKNELHHYALKPYSYKTILGIDFYNFCKSILESFPNLEWKHETVLGTHSEGIVKTENGTYRSEIIFNSIIDKNNLYKEDSNFLWQHFYGYFVETPMPVFDDTKVRWMDFNVPQNTGSSFMYLLPFSPTKALVEYTVFSDTLLDESVYKTENEHYLKNLGITDYRIYDTEYDKIPMTTFKFPRQDGKIVNIGIAGGAARASTGFTFSNVQRQAAIITNQLAVSGKVNYEYSLQEKAHRKLDKTLLHLLKNKTLTGADIFGNLFLKNDVALLLKFLDGQSSLAETLTVMNTVQIEKFTKAFFGFR